MPDVCPCGIFQFVASIDLFRVLSWIAVYSSLIFPLTDVQFELSCFNLYPPTDAYYEWSEKVLVLLHLFSGCSPLSRHCHPFEDQRSGLCMWCPLAVFSRSVEPEKTRPIELC